MCCIPAHLGLSVDQEQVQDTLLAVRQVQEGMQLVQDFMQEQPQQQQQCRTLGVMPMRRSGAAACLCLQGGDLCWMQQQPARVAMEGGTGMNRTSRG
jgi:hypothetical protein